MKLSTRAFGVSKDKEDITLFRIENTSGNAVELLDYGCTLHSIWIKDKSGQPVDICLGYDTLEGYESSDGYLGAVVGRYANRIGKGRFSLEGQDYTLAVNNGENHLHGGLKGFDKYRWAHCVEGDALVFSRTSPHGEEGYPGTVQLRVAYTFGEDNLLKIAYSAQTDRATPINLTNHAYFNLEGTGTVLEQLLQLSAQSFTENDAGCLPTGRILPVEGTPMDFRQPKPIGQDIDSDYRQVKLFGGYDHNFVLDQKAPGVCAVLSSPKTGISMAVSTTLPGVQVYTANALTPRLGKHGVQNETHGGVCLETQFFPDSLANPAFPSPVLHPGQDYQHYTSFQFFVK